jgi:hypothetical protein
MLTKLIKPMAKWGVTSIFIAYATYVCADKIDNTMNTVKYAFVETEPGFVKKEQALDMKVKYERNGKNNLETYIKTYNQKVPVYIRENGVMIGDADYLFSNFSDMEKERVCSGNYVSPKKKEARLSQKLKKMVYDLYKNLGDENNDE